MPQRQRSETSVCASSPPKLFHTRAPLQRTCSWYHRPRACPPRRHASACTAAGPGRGVSHASSRGHQMAPASISHQSVTRQPSVNHPSALARSSVISQLSLARSSIIAQSSVGHRSIVNQSPLSQHSVINQPPLTHRSVIAQSPVNHRSIIGRLSSDIAQASVSHLTVVSRQKLRSPRHFCTRKK